MTIRVLIVDDEANMRWVLKEALAAAGYEVLLADGGIEALSQLAHHDIDLVILDLKLKGMDGLSTLKRMRERWPEVVVVILTAYGTVTTAVEAMQLGAADYLRKPFEIEEIRFKLQRALERQALHAELRRLQQATPQLIDEVLVGNHPRWLRCLEQVQSLASFELDLALVGGLGTGKSLLARFVHRTSPRHAAPFVEFDSATQVPPLWQQLFEGSSTMESLLSKVGKGTLVLSHVDSWPEGGWRMVLPLLEVRRPSGPRIIMTAETYPAELDRAPFARIDVPALAERIDDLPLLVKTFAPMVELTPVARAALERYAWPGNVAELRSVIKRASLLTGDALIDLAHLPERITQGRSTHVPVKLTTQGLSLEEVEVSLIRQALDLARGNKTRAAELLGLSRSTLLYRLEKYRSEGKLDGNAPE